MLLAVAISVSCGGNTADEQSVVLHLCHIESELRQCCLARLDRELGVAAQHLSSCLWIEKHHACRSANHLVRRVRYACRDDAAVRCAYEAWHVGLNHNGLACHSRSRNHAVVHLLVVCQAVHLPRRHTFRQRKAQRYVALLVSQESRHEEGCLVEVLTHL